MAKSVSSIALLVANALPLIGVLFWGWDAARIVALYWFENVVIGGIQVLKLLTARGTKPWFGDADLAPKLPPDQARALAQAQHASKAVLIPFFVVHYGLFTLVHGVFLVSFFGRDGGLGSGVGAPFGDVPGLVGRVLSGGGGWAALALVASHLLSFAVNYIGGGEYLRKSPGQLMMEPYGRVVVLHLAIIFGGMAVQFLGNPLPLLVLLVVGKTVLDLLFHRKAHPG